MVDELTNQSKVVYIMGTARSGTTILEILLSYGKDAFGAGEITGLIEDGFIDNKLCSCGKEFNRCSVWSHVSKELNLSDYKIKQWAALQKKLDWHDGFLRQIFGNITNDERSLYQEYNQKLLNLLTQMTNAQYIIDSSKYVGRAYALSRLSDTGSKLICLTRAPAGLMSSFQKQNKDEQKPKSVLGTLIYYCYTLLSLRIVSLLLSNKICYIQYESLLKSPLQNIEKMEQYTGLDLSLTKKMLQKNEAFEVGHIITGNRLRKKESIRFEQESPTAKKYTWIQQGAIIIMNVWKWILRF